MIKSLKIIITSCARFACRKGRLISCGNSGERVFHLADQLLKGVSSGRALGRVLDLFVLVAASSVRLVGAIRIARARLSVTSESIPRSPVVRLRVVLVISLPFDNVSLPRSKLGPQRYVVVQLFVLLNLMSVANAQTTFRRLIMLDLLFRERTVFYNLDIIALRRLGRSSVRILCRVVCFLSKTMSRIGI